MHITNLCNSLSNDTTSSHVLNCQAKAIVEHNPEHNDVGNRKIYTKPSLSRDEQTYGEDEYLSKKLKLDEEFEGISAPDTALDEQPDMKQTAGNTEPTNGEFKPVDTSSTSCPNIKTALVSEGLRAEAIICLDRLLVIYPFKASRDEKQKEVMANIVSLGSFSDQKSLLTCSTVRAHLRVLGIQVDAEVCLSGLIQINL
ncbi:hypothetical protein K7432_011004 [Basidiobolus ranarum]|uniref:Uncharacterized protein n=1 Tax=Basidiobolus ranarum TaxID=34480 RepID=A0ABR2VUM7_9FUNG